MSRSLIDQADRLLMDHKQPMHTPGPWRLDDRSNAHVLGDTYHVIEAGQGHHDPDNGFTGFRVTAFISQADARLIHAAPDMAEALQKAALCLDDMEKANALLNRDVMAATCLVISNEIRNALAKAGL
jgi:hypothetical protein